jgi:exodeoxyribonuclease-1
MNTLYWHDYETFGADPARDRPVQFAGIRTDQDLKPIGKPLVVYCRPAPDFLPHPQACLITGITPQQALERGLCEAEFIQRIHAELSRSYTCGVGYNSIRFDDEITRYTLYRNFYDAYGREWQHGNSRWDLIDVVRMCYALRPEGINWPLRDTGAPSFKLEDLTVANGIGHQHAHDALADVEATIALARLLKHSQPRLYDYAYGLRRKREVTVHLNPAQPQAVLHISSRYPATRGCTALVLPIMAHPLNTNGIIVFDLAGDPAGLLDLPAEEIRRRLFSTRQALGQGVERIALKTVHINRSPMVVTPRILDEAGYQRLGIDPSVCERHRQTLVAARDAVAKKLVQVFSEVPHGDDDPDTQLYAGFFGDQDRMLMERVRAATPEQLAQDNWAFRDERLAPLLFRYRARNYPRSLSATERDEWQNWRQRRLRDPAAGAPLVFEQYRELLQQKLAEPDLTAEQRGILLALQDYGRLLQDGAGID